MPSVYTRVGSYIYDHVFESITDPVQAYPLRSAFTVPELRSPSVPQRRHKGAYIRAKALAGVAPPARYIGDGSRMCRCVAMGSDCGAMAAGIALNRRIVAVSVLVLCSSWDVAEPVMWGSRVEGL